MRNWKFRISCAKKDKYICIPIQNPRADLGRCKTESAKIVIGKLVTGKFIHFINSRHLPEGLTVPTYALVLDKRQECKALRSRNFHLFKIRNILPNASLTN